MPTLRLDGDSTGLVDAVDRASDALDALDAQAKRTKVAPDSAQVRKFEQDVRGLEAAGRILGGRYGEAAGVLADFSDVLEAGISPATALGAGVAALGLAAVGSVAGMVALTKSAIELNRETGAVDARLVEAEAAMAALDAQTAALTIALGSQAAPAVSSMTYALSGLIDMASDAAEAIGDNTPDSLGTALFASYAVAMPLTTAAVMALAKAYEYLENRGRDAAAEVTKPFDMMADLDLPEWVTDTPEAEAGRRASAAKAEADAERRRQDELRAEIDQRNRLAQEFAAGANEYRRLWEEAYKGRLAAADAVWEAQQQDSADMSALLDQQNAESEAAWQAELARLAEEKAEADDVAAKWARSYELQRESAFAFADSAINVLETLVGENEAAQIAMLALRKATAIAEIIIATQVASAQAAAQLGIASPPAVAAIQAAGAIQVGVVAAQGIAEGAAIAQQAQAQAPTINATLVIEGQPQRAGARSWRVGQR